MKLSSSCLISFRFDINVVFFVHGDVTTNSSAIKPEKSFVVQCKRDNCYESSNSFDTGEAMVCGILDGGKVCVMENKRKSFNIVPSINSVLLLLSPTLELMSFLMVSNNIIHLWRSGMKQCVDKSSINTNICGSDYVMNNGETIEPIC